MVLIKEKMSVDLPKFYGRWSKVRLAYENLYFGCYMVAIFLKSQSAEIATVTNRNSKVQFSTHEILSS